jgi:hypothetical protein
MTPSGMIAVTKAEFFRFVGPRNIHPQSEPTQSVWVDQISRETVGISTPGYKCAWDAVAAFYLKAENANLT